MANEHVAAALAQVQERPFKVFQEKARCECCGTGGSWTVELPDGSVLSTSWDDESMAGEVCEWMNDAHDIALQAVRSALQESPHG